MKGRKYLIPILVVMNVVLLFAIAAVILGRTKQTEKQETADLPTIGKNISEILGGNSRIRTEILQTQARTVVLLFFRDSSFARLIDYVHEFSRCVLPSSVKTVLFIVVCAPQEKCENIRVWEVENIREPFSVRFHSDEQNNFRRRFDVHHGATWIVDPQSLKVSRSYGYLLNPFVLCELLEREE